MNSNQRERQFDVVIIDEVSMAPLPAVYIAASRANRAVITIGDPNQLPPICQSNSKIAKEWLGTDLFFKLNVSFVIAAKGLDHCVLLEQQSRMHPAISKIAREHVYNDWIKDSPRLNSTPYSQYSEVMPLPGKQLVLCDTGDASPNATQPEGGGRINIYHALCTIELARQALASLPEPEKELQPGEFRVGLIAPYRKQAQLLQSLVKDAGLEKVVRAGTVHKFQGLEAEVIIFDTVDSTGTEPTKFINGIHGSEAMKLINVAVTRAKHKLIIVSNLEYVTKKFPYGSILRLAVEEARKSGVVKSREIFGEKLLIAQKALTKYSPNISEILSPSENDYLELYNEHTFYDQFLQDVKSATTNIIILSPFLGVIRANSIAPTIGKKIKEGVKVVIITSQLKENIKTDEARKQLENVGAEIKIQSKMHEKLVFIDERIMYFGSLNALSYIDKTNTELMIRSVLPVTIKKFWDFMKIDNKLKSPGWSESSTIEQKEDRIFLSIWELPEIPNCKKCSRKMNPRIAKKTGDPFYGCEGFFSDIECDSKENVEEDHIKRIPYIKDKICDYCGSSVKITRIPYKGFWMECAKFPQCNYKRRIVFTKK